MKQVIHNEYLLDVNDRIGVPSECFVPLPSGTRLGVHEPTFDLTMGETPIWWLVDRYPQMVPEGELDYLM